ncbi:hypothetical protein JW711_05255 [Candidatus Woesearchaeota archaeon]|nr:hypothetical protein [Candidatus Woesearchaeota archaeon]
MAEKRGELESKVVNKSILKKAVAHKIRQISDKAFISEREVYDLIRGFFKKYINIDYEFTSAELMKELKKVYFPPELQERTDHVLERISEMEHVSRIFSKEELQNLLHEFKTLVDDMIITHYEKRSFFERMRDLFHSSLSSDHKSLLQERPLSENERTVVKMNILLDNSRRWSEKDPSAAKRAYQEIIQIYDGLDEEKKKIYFKPVNELYTMLRGKGVK